MNSFLTIKNNVGTRVGDTSSSFSTIIGSYVNQRYQRLFKKFNWDIVKPDYTFNTVAGTKDYTIEAGFGKEIYVFDNTNRIDIAKVSLSEIERNYSVTIDDTGNPTKYAIYRTTDSSNPANIVLKIRLHPTPSSIIAILMPYIKAPNVLTAATDLPILDMADLAIELGATADAWRTKRQFAKAADFETQYEQVIGEMVWSQENDPNRIVQFAPNTFNKDDLY